TLQKNRNQIMCINEDIATLQVEYDTQKGIRVKLWKTLEGNINLKINDIISFMEGESGEGNVVVIQLQKSFNQMASIKSETEKLVCNTDWTSSASAPRSIKIALVSTFTKLMNDDYASQHSQEIINENKTDIIEYLKCRQYATSGTSIDHQGNQYRFRTELKISPDNPLFNSDQSQIISINSSDSKHSNLYLGTVNCGESGCTNTDNGGGGGGGGTGEGNGKSALEDIYARTKIKF
ncbi:MAG: hypothetical protein NTX25_23550, partial [Proteobacteria bacterium]|nr:hypothetical protein [Pseudomonadota bacterium]